MRVWALLADWQELDSVWSRAEEEPNFLAIAERENWIRRDSFTPANDSAVVSEAAGRLFAMLRPHLSPNEFRSLGTFLAAFSIAFFEEDELREFEAPSDLSYVRSVYFSVISPNSVNRLLKLVRLIDLENVARRAELLEQSPYEYSINATEFVDYVQMWTNVLQEAKMLGRGVLVGCG